MPSLNIYPQVIYKGALASKNRRLCFLHYSAQHLVTLDDPGNITVTQKQQLPNWYPVAACRHLSFIFLNFKSNSISSHHVSSLQVWGC